MAELGAMQRPQKIIFGKMRGSGVAGGRCRRLLPGLSRSHSTTLPANRWPDEVRLSDVEQFVCKACGHRGADVSRCLREKDRRRYELKYGPSGAWGRLGPLSEMRLLCREQNRLRHIP